MRTRSTVLVSALILAAHGALADDAPRITRIDPPKRMLFLGNSFTYFNAGVPHHVRELAASADPAHNDAYYYAMATLSGATLRQLDSMMPIIKSEKFDIVVLQGQSLEPIASKEDSEKFRAAVRAFDRAIRDSGAKTVLYMTWAFGSKPDIATPLARAYVAAGNEVGALVVPVGLAFEASRRDHPAIDLYYVDQKHPSLAGTYLAACVFYAALYGRSPEGNEYLGGLSAGAAHDLQRTAWDTVTKFYGSPPGGR